MIERQMMGTGWYKELNDYSVANDLGRKRGILENKSACPESTTLTLQSIETGRCLVQIQENDLETQESQQGENGHVQLRLA
jgi:hypothetical protein